ncbi:hypothetical protein SNE40_018513 [Patella caerulea]|uniref:Calpain-9 n=1 Tax=Patella caerulea TaxID=87958 RepID=A0AAN8P407_PATCE
MAHIRGYGTHQLNYATVRDHCLKTGSLFVDPGFPPEERSLYLNGQRDRQFGRVVWKRPREICSRPRFVVGNIDRHDLDQGYIGDCWFVAAAATLCTSHRNIFERVVPLDQTFDTEYTGVFRFNFWWYGDWKEVIVDDYLPTDGTKLIFCRNRESKDEFWSALLEKAYAKLRGGYSGLVGGKIQDGLVDFTGGISEVIDLSNKDKIPRKFFYLLYKSISMNSMVGASIHKHPNEKDPEIELTNGLYAGHAYSITAIKKVPLGRYSVSLIRLRNPWGKNEWTGRWSDRSEEIETLPPAVRNELRFKRANDGEFWMCYEDLINIFDEIQMCHLQPDALTKEIADDEGTTSWNVTIYHDAWKKGISAGGCGNPPNENLYWKNPQFFITLTDTDEKNPNAECTLIVSLTEKEYNNQSDICIGFAVYKLISPDMKPLDGERASRNSMRLTERSGQYEYNREVTRRFELTPGVYVIIPSTFHPHAEAKFLLRLFTEKRAESGVLDIDNPRPVSPNRPPVPHVITPTCDLITELFLQYSGKDKRLDYKEVRSFILAASSEEMGEEIKFSKEACRSLVACMARNRSGLLDINETRKMWREITVYKSLFKHFDNNNTGTVDGTELQNMFTKLGLQVDKILIQCILRRYGGRGSTLSLDAFIIVIFKLILMFELFQEHREKTKRGGLEDVAQFTRSEFLQYTMFG